MAIKCGKHGRESVYHASVDDVRRCYQGQDVADVRSSGKRDRRLVDPTCDSAAREGIQRSVKAARFDPEKLEDGFYALPSDSQTAFDASFEVYKVVVAVHGSGRKYAKRLNIETGEWEMAPGAVRQLRPEMRMTLKEALKVAKVVATDVEGRLYGRCFVCGKPLTREDSIERMMGPVCAGKFA